MTITQKALELYNNKLATGKYNDYSNNAKAVLFEDCVKQAGTMKRYG